MSHPPHRKWDKSLTQCPTQASPSPSLSLTVTPPPMTVATPQVPSDRGGQLQGEKAANRRPLIHSQRLVHLTRGAKAHTQSGPTSEALPRLHEHLTPHLGHELTQLRA